MRALKTFLLLLAGYGFALWPTPANALVLDWSSVTWTPGSLTQSYDLDPTIPGDEITITITGDTADFFAGAPLISQTVTGGTGGDALELHLNLQKATDQITVTVTFNYALGVDGVSFDLFNVDADAKNNPEYIDQISNITGQFGTNSAFGALITPSTDNTVSGTGTGQTVTGTTNDALTSGDANVNIDFGTNALTSFTFTYGNGPGSRNNPKDEEIGLYDIYFHPRVPEKGTLWGALAACSMIGFLARHRWS